MSLYLTKKVTVFRAKTTVFGHRFSDFIHPFPRVDFGGYFAFFKTGISEVIFAFLAGISGGDFRRFFAFLPFGFRRVFARFSPCADSLFRAF